MTQVKMKLQLIVYLEFIEVDKAAIRQLSWNTVVDAKYNV